MHAVETGSRAATFVRRMHGRPAEGVHRWITVTAVVATLLPLPSGIWRIALGLGAPLGPITGDASDARGQLPTWMPLWLYPILLTLLSEGVAFLAMGLVSRWGEVVPRWIPFLGGRGVPTAVAVIPAGLGAIVLTVMTFAWAPGMNHFTVDGQDHYLHGWKLAVFVASYGPLLAWGPLLAIVTVAYHLRRTRRRPGTRPPAR